MDRHAKNGDVLFAKTEKISAEFFSMTYGSLVMQLLKDHRDDHVEVNAALDKMGYNIGVRLIDEFLVQSGISNCRNFKETAEVIGKIAFKLFLGISAQVKSWSEDGNSFVLSLPSKDNPITDFVELPSGYEDLSYSNLLCGVIRGALEIVQISVECSIVKDSLKGDDTTDIRVLKKSILHEAYQPDED